RNRWAARRDYVGRQKIVARRPIKTHQPAVPAAQRKSGNSDLRVRAARNRQANGLGCPVELGPSYAALSARRPVGGIHFDCLHERKVDHQSIIADGCAGNIVSAPSHGGEKLVLASETDRSHDVRIIGAKRYKSGPTVNPSVPDLSPGVVADVAWTNKLPTQSVFEILYRSEGNGSRHFRRLLVKAAGARVIITLFPLDNIGSIGPATFSAT